MQVDQSFGNCPKYIQAREAVYVADNALAPKVVHRAKRLDDEGTLTVPDFLGNFFFNTLGNLAVSTEIIWDGAALAAFAGAQRLLRMQVRAMVRVPASLPLRWGAAQTAS